MAALPAVVSPSGLPLLPAGPGGGSGGAAAMDEDDSLLRKALAHMAGAAQKVGRFSDMLEAVNMLVANKAKIGSPLTREEVELIFDAYEIVLSDKHNACRTISRMEEEEEQHSGKSAASVSLEVYREVVEKDMDTTRRDVLHIFQHHLLPSCSGEENVALYTKMLGGINWILTLRPKIEDKELHVESTFAAYEAASKAVEKLSAAHPLRLALDLTKTAFYIDVIEWPEEAIALARQALHDAGPELASLDEESSKKSAEIMGLMEEKLKLWEPTSPSSKDYSEPSSENDITSKLASFSLEEEPSYSVGSPSGGLPSPPPPPVIPHPAGPTVAPNEFISPGDWGYEVHEGLTRREIRYRKKAAKIRRGFMG